MDAALEAEAGGMEEGARGGEAPGYSITSGSSTRSVACPMASICRAYPLVAAAVVPHFGQKGKNTFRLISQLLQRSNNFSPQWTQ